ncbi:MAG: redoxin domain-containing protein [Flavisolibacter sp.]
MKKLLGCLAVMCCLFMQTRAQEFRINGQLESFRPVDKIFLSYADGDNYRRDSLEPKDGHFQFSGKLSEPTSAFLMVRYRKQEGEERGRQENMQFFLEPAKMEILATDSLDHYKVSGSKGEGDFEKLIKGSEAYSPALEKLYTAYNEARKAGNKEEMEKVEKDIRAMDSEMKEKVYAGFIRENPRSPVVLYALQTYAGYDIDPAKVEPLFDRLSPAQQKGHAAQALKERIDIAKKTAVGSYAMDFIQNDTLGKPVSLSSFKGKYVLVDFWACWCGPCRAENPNVVQAYQHFREKNFTIISVSLDRPGQKEKWLKAIHDDGLSWNHVSDLKFWDNAVAKQYGIRAIPQNILVDPQGRIIARNLRGAELEQRLAALL